MSLAGRRPWVVGVSGASGTPYAASVLRGLLAAEAPVDLVISRAARLTLLDETGIAWRDGAWRDCLTAWLCTPLGPARPDPDESGALIADVDKAEGAEGAETSCRVGVAGSADVGSQLPTDSVTYGDADVGRSASLPGPDGIRDAVERLVRHHGPADLAAAPSSGSYPTAGMIVVPASTACVAGIALGLSKDLLQRAADVTLKERRRLVVVPREMPYTRSTLRHMLDLHDAGAVVAAASPGFYAGAVDAQALVDFVAGRVLDAAGVPNDLFRRWTGELGAARRAEE